MTEAQTEAMSNLKKRVYENWARKYKIDSKFNLLETNLENSIQNIIEYFRERGMIEDRIGMYFLKNGLILSQWNKE
jgi:hypothetical protein